MVMCSRRSLGSNGGSIFVLSRRSERDRGDAKCTPSVYGTHRIVTAKKRLRRRARKEKFPTADGTKKNGELTVISRVRQYLVRFVVLYLVADQS
ncbi:hypothetical protein E4T56_gene11453 [Termitomyces sp. T112]|nr:hypothetical protein E4T56_gene11453 [Termitomyces sp. T112]